MLVLLKKGSGGCDLELSAWQTSAESWDNWMLLRGEEEAFSCLGFSRINLLGPLSSRLTILQDTPQSFSLKFGGLKKS